MDELYSIIEQISLGDKSALRKFIEIKGSFIKKIAFSVLSDITLCDDILNEIIFKVWQNAHKIVHYKNIDGFIYTITYNASIDLKRKTNRLFTLSDEALNSLTNEKTKINDEVERIHIHGILEKLDPEERQILILNTMYGYSIAQCAKAADLSYFQTRSTLRKAKNKFKKQYEK